MRALHSLLGHVSVFVLVASFTIPGAANGHFVHDGSQAKETSVFQLKSNAFRANGEIPARYSCEGENISPELTWSGAPKGTKSFALVLHDPDAPHPGGYTHWVVFNIPADVTNIAENVPKQANFRAEELRGKTTAAVLATRGPARRPEVIDIISTSTPWTESSA